MKEPWQKREGMKGRVKGEKNLNTAFTSTFCPNPFKLSIYVSKTFHCRLHILGVHVSLLLKVFFAVFPTVVNEIIANGIVKGRKGKAGAVTFLLG